MLVKGKRGSFRARAVRAVWEQTGMLPTSGCKYALVEPEYQKEELGG
jgi:hypothetical protein